MLPPIPAAPVLSSPANATLTNNPTPAFSWNSITAGNTYQIQIDNIKTFAHPEQTYTGAVGELSYTAASLTDGLWYWRVRALNINAEPGAWSAYRLLTVDTLAPLPPVLYSPANDNSLRSTPALYWHKAATATAYQFEYDDNEDFSSPVHTSSTLASPRYGNPTYKPPTIDLGTYSWHARARDAAGNWSDWSTPFTLTMLPPIPAAPVLSSPANALLTSNPTPIFSWNGVAGGNTYQIQIDNITTFAHPEQTYTTSIGELSYNASLVPNGIWYWRVRALNINAEPGAWSAYRKVQIRATTP
jgi:predicted secreted protein